MASEYPYHYPNALRSPDQYEKEQEAIALIKDGVPIADAVAAAYNVSPKRWYYWVKDAEEDIEKGIRSSDLISLVYKLTAVDINIHRKFSKRAQQLALDPDEPSVEMLKFLMERRYGYKKKSQQEVEVSTPDDFSFNINITESQKKDE